MYTKLKNFFLDHINFCYPKKSDGADKPQTWWYHFYRALYWPIPQQDTPCWCCASIRGIIYGILLGVGLYKFWGWL